MESPLNYYDRALPLSQYLQVLNQLSNCDVRNTFATCLRENLIGTK